MSPSFPVHPSRTRKATLRRRWIPGLLAIVPVLAGAAAVAPSARADTGYGYCQAASCNGLDPLNENCQVNAFTVSSWSYTYPNGGGRYEVDLRYSPDCEANWARVVTATAVPFCVKNTKGNVQTYTSAPGLTSWTNMVNGAPSIYDTAYLGLPSPTDQLGQTVLWASDGGTSGTPVGGESMNYPC